MAEVSLQGRRILVVEDEYMLADELRAELQDVEAIVIGPVGQLDAATDLINAEPRIDGAILDVNLGGETVFPAADILAARGVPMVFTTGYDASSIPERYGHIARCEKPLSMSKVAGAIARDPCQGASPATF